jgi:hypothetical protein
LPGPRDYFLATPTSPLAYLSLMVLVIILACAGWGLLLLARRSTKPHPILAVRGLFLIAAGIGLFSLGHEGWVLMGSPDLANWMALAAGLVAIATAIWLSWRRKGWHRHVLPVSIAVMMTLAPLAPILFAQGAYHMAIDRSKGDEWDGTPNAPLDAEHQAADTRVVWIVLDEMDQRLVFEDRPEGYTLKELDDLRETAFSADAAHAPHERTLYSIPMMTTGRSIDQVTPQGPDRLQLHFTNGESISWDQSDTIFHSANEKGLRTAIIGTYHPYCRVFQEQLSQCTFYEYEGPDADSLGHQVRMHLHGLASAIPVPPLRTAAHGLLGIHTPLYVLHQQSAIMNHEHLAPRAVQAAADPTLDFVKIHLMTPHPAGFANNGHGYWDPTTKTFTTGAGPTYYDNLQLADHTLAQIRQAMQQNQVWDNTFLVVTSDHGYRYGIWGESIATQAHAEALHQPTDHRVPLLIKPPDPHPEPFRYDETINLLQIRDLLEDALDGQLTHTQDLVDWFHAHPSPPLPEYGLR